MQSFRMSLAIYRLVSLLLCKSMLKQVNMEGTWKGEAIVPLTSFYKTGPSCGNMSAGFHEQQVLTFPSNV